MKEPAFVKLNKARWQEFEKVVSNQQKTSPDHLAELFLQITDDLSFSRTQYPKSRTTQYLNALASKIHLEIYKNKREEKNRFITFWKQEVPAAVYESRKALLIALIIFLVSVVMGVVSAQHDDTFVRLILGDGYVNMTLENIRSGNPTGVYGSMNEFVMFLRITLNNIMVSFYVFVYGIIASLGTGFLLFRNGVMMGAFVMLFAQESMLTHALPVIMLHGTIELSSIVIAGGAGFVMGNSLIFPGTYSRIESFKIGALKGLKIVVGLVPFFMMAGFIESYITRFEFMHWVFKSIVIGGSAILMIFYFVIYPYLLRRHGKI